MEEMFKVVRLMLAEYKRQNDEDAKLEEGDYKYGNRCKTKRN